MKTNKGFTLVELLAVIVLIGLIVVIAVPLIQQTSARIKGNILETKVSSAEKSLLMWSQENEKCFMDTTGKDCIVGVNHGCESDGDNLICHATFRELAENSLISYDKNNKVLNPVDDSDMSDDTVQVVYNKYKRIFTIGTGANTHTTKTPITYTNPTREATTAPLFSESVPPMIRFDIETNTNWAKKQNVIVIVQDVDSGLAAGGNFKYGWSTSNTVQPSQLSSTVSLTYNEGTRAEVRTTVSNNDLTGKYYLWIIPNIKDRQNNAAQTKVSTGTYWLDNTPPNAINMNFIYSNGTVHSGGWTNQNLYAARTQANPAPSGGADAHSGFDKYQMSLNNSTWFDYSYDETISNYLMSTEGVHHRYFRACDKLGNCTAGLDVVGQIDKTKPTIASMSATTSQVTFALKDDRSGIGSYCLIDVNDPTGCTWTSYTGSTPLNTGNLSVTNPHPGRTVYLFARDKAGNISDTLSKDTTCNDVRYSDGTTCTKVCGSGTYNRLAYDSHSGERCSSKDQSSGGSACNTQSCCASTENYNCGSWTWSSCSIPCGGGTKYQYRTCSKRSAYDHTTACSGTATETQNTGTACNTGSCNKTMYWCVQGNANVHETLGNISCSGGDGGQCYTKNNVFKVSEIVKPNKVQGTQRDGGPSGDPYYMYYELVTPISWTAPWGSSYQYRYIVWGCLKDSIPTASCNSDSNCAG